MKKFIAVFCALVLLTSVTGCGHKLEGGQPDAEVISNGGIAVKQGDWLYFINGSMPDKAGEAVKYDNRARIYRIKADGSECAPITDKKAFGMYVCKSFIYYTSPTLTDVVLYRIGIDGSDNKKLFTFSDKDFVDFGSNGVAVAHGESIFYFDYISGKKTEFEVGSKSSGLRISDSYIYFYAQNVKGTKCIDIKTGNIEMLCEENGPLLYVDDTNVFFASARVPYHINANTFQLDQISESLYRSILLNYKNSAIICMASNEEEKGLYLQPMENIAGEAVEEGGNRARILLHSKSASAYCLNDDYIFFVEEETGDIYRMTYEGKDKLKLGNMKSVFSLDSIDIVGDTLFLFDSVESGCAYMVPADGSGELSLIIREE